MFIATAMLAFFTMLLWHDTHRLLLDAEDTAARHAAQTKESLALTKQAADAATASANSSAKLPSVSEKAFTSGQRARLGPTNASMSAEPTKGKPVEIIVQIQNTGREPAQNFSWNSPDWFVSAERNIETRTLDYKRSCTKIPSARAGQVIYANVNGYRLSFKLDGLLVNEK
ncbi:MAG TPA: hypothetical protein VLV32_08915 [Burkholderiales bacterium]|nr:hypothetical protein [Burkholderiales bacterium]